MSLLQRLWWLLRGALLTLAALVLLFEEWGWRPLVAAAARLAHWPPLARLEQRIRLTSPRVALALFLLPSLLLIPVKLLALWAVQLGHAWLGLAVIIVAKLFGTALVGRLFVLTESQLMQFAGFVRALDWWRRTKLAIRAAVRASLAGRLTRIWLRRSRRWMRQWSR